MNDVEKVEYLMWELVTLAKEAATYEGRELLPYTPWLRDALDSLEAVAKKIAEAKRTRRKSLSRFLKGTTNVFETHKKKSWVPLWRLNS